MGTHPADVAQHVADALVVSGGMDRGAAINAIKDAFDEELRAPSSGRSGIRGPPLRDQMGAAALETASQRNTATSAGRRGERELQCTSSWYTNFGISQR